MKIGSIKFKDKRLSNGEQIEGDLVHTDSGTIIMEIYKDTYDVIDNPNFREILNLFCKKKLII